MTHGLYFQLLVLRRLVLRRVRSENVDGESFGPYANMFFLYSCCESWANTGERRAQQAGTWRKDPDWFRWLISVVLQMAACTDHLFLKIKNALPPSSSFLIRHVRFFLKSPFRLWFSYLLEIAERYIDIWVFKSLYWDAGCCEKFQNIASLRARKFIKL